MYHLAFLLQQNTAYRRTWTNKNPAISGGIDSVLGDRGFAKFLNLKITIQTPVCTKTGKVVAYPFFFCLDLAFLHAALQVAA
jgi:hypothetical protein